MMVECTKVLRFCAGHRLLGHEGHCAHLHGHNYRAEVTCVARGLDPVGRVVDFSVIKQRVGAWIDEHWDHGFLVNDADEKTKAAIDIAESKAWAMGCNPTAENIAQVLLDVANNLLEDTPCEVKKIRLWETDTCYAEAYSTNTRESPHGQVPQAEAKATQTQMRNDENISSR